MISYVDAFWLGLAGGAGACIAWRACEAATLALAVIAARLWIRS